MRSVGVTEAELHAYADGQLTEARAVEVAGWLGEHPAESARVAAWRAQNEAIRRAFPPPPRDRIAVAYRAAEPRPAADPPIASSIATYRVRQKRRRAFAMGLAFGLGAMLAGGSALLLPRLISEVRSSAPAPAAPVVTLRAESAPLSAGAWRAYAEDRLRPVEISIRDRAALVAWLGQRTGLTHVPEIASARLLGGRVVPGLAGAAAFLLYETGGGDRIALTAERGAADIASDMESDGLNTIGWRSGPLAVSVSAKMPPTRLKTFADGLAEAMKVP